jgi:hypothetical protein
LDLVNSTGEIRPQAISPSFNRSQLLGIDRISVSQTPDPNAGAYSTVGVGAAVAFAFIDPVLSGFREKSVQTGIADGVLYAESVSLTYAATNMVKMGVRQPRPYAAQRRPWITLILATGLSTFVSIERVTSGAHFPTDVIAATVAGAGIGVVVPHLHRTDDIKQRRVWVGYTAPPSPDGYEQPQGGMLTASGFF